VLAVTAAAAAGQQQLQGTVVQALQLQL